MSRLEVESSSGFKGQPFELLHHQEIAQRFLRINPHRRPVEVRQYHSWSDVQNMPNLTSDTLVFVDGGTCSMPLDVGSSSLVCDGGIVEAEIFCGVFYTDGGLVNARVHERDKVKKLPRKTTAQLPIGNQK